MMEDREVFDSQAEHTWENTVFPRHCVPLQTITHSYRAKGPVSPQPPAQASGPAGEPSSITTPPPCCPSTAPGREAEEVSDSSLSAQLYVSTRCLCELFPLVFSLSPVGCIDSERVGSELMSSVTSGWGLRPQVL